MANIQNELDKIRSTQYGGEVRVAVHDGLKKVNEDVEAMSTADASDVGKALKAKTVENGKVKEWEFGEAAVIDDTLSNEGEAADAKATGDALAAETEEREAADAELKNAVNSMSTATVSDAGKALKAKTVSNGKVTEWEFGETAVIDDTLSNEGEAADAKATGDAIFAKVNKPTSSPNGTAGQLLRTNGDGTTQWVNQGLPTDKQTADAVEAWLNDHPEATTTVEDGSITYAKLNSAVSEDIVGAKNAITQLDEYTEIVAKTDVSATYNNAESITDVRIYGNEYAFGNAFICDRQNMMPSLPYQVITSPTKPISATYVDRFIIVDGSTDAYALLRNHSEWVPVSGLTPGNYKIVIDCVGTFTATDSPFIRIIAKGTSGEKILKTCYIGISNTRRTWDATVESGYNDALYVIIAISAGFSGYRKFWVGLYKSDYTMVDTEQQISDGNYADIEVNPSDYKYGLDTVKHFSTVTYNPSVQNYIDNKSIDIDEELTYITPEAFGAKGDNIADDSQAFTDCIAYAQRNKKSVRAFKKYYISTPISIITDGGTSAINDALDIFINSVRYNGNDAAVILSGRDVHLHINVINSSAVGFRMLGVPNKNNSYNNIETDYVLSTGNCIEILNGATIQNPVAASMFYNTFKSIHLQSSSQNGIYIEASYGEKTFWCGDIRAANGWAIMTYDSCCTFYTPSMEVGRGIYLRGKDNAGNVFFCGRFREMIDKIGSDPNDPTLGLLFKFDYIGHNNLMFARDSVPANAIDISEQQDAPDQPQTWKGATRLRIIGSNMFINGGQLYYACDGQEILVRYNRVVVANTPKRSYDVSSNMDMRGYNTWYSLYTRFVAKANATIYLNESYCSVGVSSIMLNQTNDYKLTVYDCRGNLVFDGANQAAGEYKLTAIYDASSSRINDVEHDTWIVQVLNILT